MNEWITEQSIFEMDFLVNASSVKAVSFTAK